MGGSKRWLWGAVSSWRDCPLHFRRRGRGGPERIRGPKVREHYMSLSVTGRRGLALERGKLDVPRGSHPSFGHRGFRGPAVFPFHGPGFHMAQVGFNLRNSPWNLPELEGRPPWSSRDRLVRELFSVFGPPGDVPFAVPPIADKGAAVRAGCGRSEGPAEKGGLVLGPSGVLVLPKRSNRASRNDPVSHGSGWRHDGGTGGPDRRGPEGTGIPSRPSRLDFAAMVSGSTSGSSPCTSWPGSLAGIRTASIRSTTPRRTSGGVQAGGAQGCRSRRLLEAFRSCSDERQPQGRG
jgi:hypothetical protein